MGRPDMKISEILFTEMNIGDKVIGANGTPGEIVCLISKEYTARREDDEIVIEWVHGGHSRAWHFWFNKVEYKGK